MNSIASDTEEAHEETHRLDIDGKGPACAGNESACVVDREIVLDERKETGQVGTACTTCSELRERIHSLSLELAEVKDRVTIANYSVLDAESEHQSIVDSLAQATAKLSRVTSEFQQAQAAWREREEGLYRQMLDERVLRVAESEELRLQLSVKQHEIDQLLQLKPVSTHADGTQTEAVERSVELGKITVSPADCVDTATSPLERASTPPPAVHAVADEVTALRLRHAAEIAEMNNDAEVLYQRLADTLAQMAQMDQKDHTYDCATQTTCAFPPSGFEVSHSGESRSRSRAPADHEFVVSSILQSAQNSPQLRTAQHEVEDAPDSANEDSPAASALHDDVFIVGNQESPTGQQPDDRRGVIDQTTLLAKSPPSPSQDADEPAAYYRDDDDVGGFDVVEVTSPSASPKSDDRRSSANVTPAEQMIEAARSSSKSVTFNFSKFDEGKSCLSANNGSPTKPILKNSPMRPLTAIAYAVVEPAEAPPTTNSAAMCETQPGKIAAHSQSAAPQKKVSSGCCS